MKKINYFEFKSIYFIGIGGISMSALAFLMLNQQKHVYGSDIYKSEITKELEEKGAIIYYNQKINNINKKCDVVVYTGAISHNCAEMKFALANNIPLISRADFLAKVCELYDTTISISGTHGKTSTTALIGDIFMNSGKNPTIHVGGDVVSLSGNLKIGEKNYFVTEACEYKKSFESIYSSTCIITNIEEDHMDCYKDLNDIKQSFLKFASQAKNVITFYDNDIIPLIPRTINVITCGKQKESDYCVLNEKRNKFGCYSFDVLKHGKYFGQFSLNVMGEYNMANALYAIAVCDYYGIAQSVINGSLKSFKGIKRRNELVGSINTVPIFADYSHHPTEIKKSIENFKSIYKNVFVVFQPHTYSRTVALKKEFITCFKNANKLIIYKTYPAREEPMEGGDAKDIYDSLKKSCKNKFYCATSDSIQYILENHIGNSKVVLVLGAGDLYDIVKKIKFNVRKK